MAPPKRNCLPSSSSASSSYEDSEDDFDMSASSSSSSVVRPEKKQLPKGKSNSKKPSTSKEPMSAIQKQRFEAEINRLVHDTVYYLLVSGGKRHVIKKADIIKNVIKDYRKEFNSIILKAKEELKMTFGVQIIELKEKKASYFLVNVDKNKKISVLTDNQLIVQGFINFILTMIWMKDGVVSEEELWKALKTFDENIDVENNKHHPIFGDIRKFVTVELVKKLYICCEKVGDYMEFQWGPRAFEEIDKKAMLDFVSEIFGNEPQNWIGQYQQIKPTSNDS